MIKYLKDIKCYFLIVINITEIYFIQFYNNFITLTTWSKNICKFII